MKRGTEYLINVTAVYRDGRKDSIVIRHNGSDGESACNAISSFFKNYENCNGVQLLTTTLVGPAGAFPGK